MANAKQINYILPLKYGTVVFGQVNGHPPARWRYNGLRNGAHELEHITSGSQRQFSPQFVSAAVLASLEVR